MDVLGDTLTETARPGQAPFAMSYFKTGGPGQEHRTNEPPPTGRTQERSKGDAMCPTTPQNSSRLASVLAEQ